MAWCLNVPKRPMRSFGVALVAGAPVLVPLAVVGVPAGRGGAQDLEVLGGVKRAGPRRDRIPRRKGGEKISVEDQ